MIDEVPRSYGAFDRMLLNYRQSRNAKRRAMVTRFQYRYWNRLFPWMNTPVLQYVTSFWIGLIDDGPYAMLKPRWGGITFGWLNDGFRPTVWHTLRQLTHRHDDPYCGIYPSGAPRSLAEAQEWDAKWKAEHR